jgi:hypothetical protein
MIYLRALIGGRSRWRWFLGFLLLHAGHVALVRVVQQAEVLGQLDVFFAGFSRQVVRMSGRGSERCASAARVVCHDLDGVGRPGNGSGSDYAFFIRCLGVFQQTLR